jgi:formylglycine-generating enzyme required for sulfatase activity
MSVREFAAHLGVSERMVSKWEAGGLTVRPRPLNQAALDTSLAHAGPDVHARFAATMNQLRSRRPGRPPVDPPEPGEPSGLHVVVHPFDQKPMVLVDAGAFPSGPEATAIWLAAYYLDVTPTTNAEYARFVAATGHVAPAHWPDGADPPDRRDHPVVGVSWEDARAYARWAAKVLPSTLEWEKAARGLDGLLYPWGDLASADLGNVVESGVGSTTPVHRYHSGVSPYGAYDMCGNVWEWCTDEPHEGRRPLKGGAFTTLLEEATALAVWTLPGDAREPDVGFRCVVSASQLLELLAI